MSTENDTKQTTEVANYDEELAKLASAATKTERAETSNVNVKAGMILYNKEPCAGNKLDCIVIASTHANLYYEDEYDPDNIKNPVCYAYSADPETEPMRPHPKCQKPQAEFCETCWANKWRTDPKGGKGKACKNSRRLALIPAGVQLEDVPTAEIATMNLPVTSVANWGTYVNKIATLYRRPPLGVITTIGVVPDIKTQFKVTFANGPLVANDLIGSLFSKAKEAQAVIEKVYGHNTEEQDEQAAEKKERKEARGKKF